ncbi:hypothetical protein [Allosalinactinospora lopnorensis]|uniref:hypothetical protein n=1 Tax=Allosalinactinospora lopnorensis TaxID=1352348 RepID=UPI000623E191|nr:hypothetical protein [Allosalinactinospora lopnorensis]
MSPNPPRATTPTCGSEEVSALYESPFTAPAPNGPEDIFSEADIDVLAAIQATAVPEEETR